jgi:4'-phosphopantetheinyl transferase
MSAPSHLEPARATPGGGARSPIWRLRAAQVDLWIVALDDLPPALLERARTLISAEEAERARRFHFDRDESRFAAGRAVLRWLLGRYLGQEPQQVQLCYGAAGKPRLVAAAGGTPGLHFNVAHSEGLALIALTRVGEIGVDVERIREIPEWESIASSCFPADAAALRRMPDLQRREAFFRAWTRHEARLKATGTGLGGSGGRGAGGPERAGTGLDNEGDGLAVHPLTPAPGHVGTLAVDCRAQWLNTFSWPPPAPLDFPDRRPGVRVRLLRSPLVPT